MRRPRPPPQARRLVLATRWAPASTWVGRSCSSRECAVRSAVQTDSGDRIRREILGRRGPKGQWRGSRGETGGFVPRHGQLMTGAKCSGGYNTWGWYRYRYTSARGSPGRRGGPVVVHGAPTHNPLHNKNTYFVFHLCDVTSLVMDRAAMRLNPTPTAPSPPPSAHGPARGAVRTARNSRLRTGPCGRGCTPPSASTGGAL